MKKQNIIIPAIIIIIAIIIVLVTVPWNQVKEEHAVGTVGKVDKYQSEQMGERSVKIRSEFVKDSTLLIKTIKELISFTIFSNQTVLNIETWWIPELKKYYSTSKSQKNIKELEDYVTLLKNSNQTLQDVIQMLADFYAGTNKDQTVDVEGKLIAFSNFVNQMVQRDSCFEAIITDIDQTIKDSKELKLRKEVIAKLKALRDRILIDNLQYAVAIGDNVKATFAANLFLYNTDNLIKLIESKPGSISSSGEGSLGLFSIPVINNILQNQSLSKINLELFGSLQNGVPANFPQYYSTINKLVDQAFINSYKNQVGSNLMIGECLNVTIWNVQKLSNQGGNTYNVLIPSNINSASLGLLSFQLNLFNSLMKNQTLNQFLNLSF